MIDRYSRPDFRSLWSEEAKYAAWGQVERAHLATLVQWGKAPEAVLSNFDRATKVSKPEQFLEKEQETGHDVIAYVAVISAAMGSTGTFLHQGLTSSDVVDTALSLRVRRSLEIIEEGLANVRKALCQRSFEHSATLCMGRTHGIHAEPLSFGQVLASHFAEFQRVQVRLLEATRSISVAKLSGAVGAYSQLSVGFEKAVLAELNLAAEDVSTQVVPRDRLAQVAHFMTDFAGAVERFATNLRHWARTELGEVTEAFSAKQKGSSAMPHKKNPILAENLCGLARTVKGLSASLLDNVALWHERDISHSSVERLALPDALTLCDFMATRLAGLVEGMVIRPDAMQHNMGKLGGLWASQSLLTALVQKGVDRQEAYEAIQKVALPLSQQAAATTLAPDAFLKGVQSTALFSSKLDGSELAKVFATDRFLECVPAVYQRTFGMVPEEWNRLEGKNPEVKVPALQRVFHVEVQLNPDVLDTEAKTVEIQMKKSGIPLQSLRQFRTFVVRLPLGSKAEAVQEYANGVLHNAVMENVKVEAVQ